MATPEEFMERIKALLTELGTLESTTGNKATELLTELQTLLEKLEPLVEKTGEAATLIRDLRDQLASGNIPADAIGPEVVAVLEAYKGERETESATINDALDNATGEVNTAVTNLDAALTALEDALNYNP